MPQQRQPIGTPLNVRVPLIGSFTNRDYSSSKDQRFVNVFPERGEGFINVEGKVKDYFFSFRRDVFYVDDVVEFLPIQNIMEKYEGRPMAINVRRIGH